MTNTHRPPIQELLTMTEKKLYAAHWRPSMTDRKHFKAGDVWRHPSFGKLYITDDISEKEAKKWPGMFKCYWSSGGNPNAPWTFLAPDNPLIKRMTLVSELATEDTAA